MKIRRCSFAIIFLAFLFVFLPNSIASESYIFDMELGKFEQFEGQKYINFSTTIVEVRTSGHAVGCYWNDEGEYKKAYGFFEMLGVGFIVGDYVITASHLITPKEITIQVSDNFYLGVPPISLRDRQIRIGEEIASVPAWIYYINEEYDIAITATGTPSSKSSIKYELAPTIMMEPWVGYIELLEEGVPVAVIARQIDEETNEWGAWFEIRYGKIRSNKAIVPETFKDVLLWFNLNDFTMDLKINPGDSGSPVFAFIDGKPVIIGIVRACLWLSEETYSFAGRIDPAIMVVNST